MFGYPRFVDWIFVFSSNTFLYSSKGSAPVSLNVRLFKPLVLIFFSISAFIEATINLLHKQIFSVQQNISLNSSDSHDLCLMFLSQQVRGKKLLVELAENSMLQAFFGIIFQVFVKFAFYNLQEKYLRALSRENRCPFPFPRTNWSHRIYGKSGVTTQSCAVWHTAKKRKPTIIGSLCSTWTSLTQICTKFRSDISVSW